MAKFYGVLRGRGKNEKTICGTSFVMAKVMSWDNQYRITLDKVDGIDRLVVERKDLKTGRTEEVYRCQSGSNGTSNGSPSFFSESSSDVSGSPSPTPSETPATTGDSDGRE